MLQRLSKYVGALEMDIPDLNDEDFKTRICCRANFELGRRYPSTVTDFVKEWTFPFNWAVKNASLHHQYAIADEQERSHFLGLQIFQGAEHITPHQE